MVKRHNQPKPLQPISPEEDRQAVAQTVEILARGGVIVYPTETVYGLGALVPHTAAIERIARLKGSRPEATYLMLINQPADMERYAESIPRVAFDLAQRFWPGPLTLILPARSNLHPRLIGSSGGVGLRVSSHPFSRMLLEKLDQALVSTSANFTGQSAPMAIQELDAELAQGADLVIDKGVLSGLASTVVDLCKEPPEVSRVGAIAPEEIAKVVGRLQIL